MSCQEQVLPDDSECEIVFLIAEPFEPPGLFQVLVLVVPGSTRLDVRGTHWLQGAGQSPWQHTVRRQGHTLAAGGGSGSLAAHGQTSGAHTGCRGRVGVPGSTRSDVRGTHWLQGAGRGSLAAHGQTSGAHTGCRGRVGVPGSTRSDVRGTHWLQGAGRSPWQHTVRRQGHTLPAGGGSGSLAAHGQTSGAHTACRGRVGVPGSTRSDVRGTHCLQGAGRSPWQHTVRRQGHTLAAGGGSGSLAAHGQTSGAHTGCRGRVGVPGSTRSDVRGTHWLQGAGRGPWQHTVRRQGHTLAAGGGSGSLAAHGQTSGAHTGCRGRVGVPGSTRSGAHTACRGRVGVPGSTRSDVRGTHRLQGAGRGPWQHTVRRQGHTLAAGGGLESLAAHGQTSGAHTGCRGGSESLAAHGQTSGVHTGCRGRVGVPGSTRSDVRGTHCPQGAGRGPWQHTVRRQGHTLAAGGGSGSLAAHGQTSGAHTGCRGRVGVPGSIGKTLTVTHPQSAEQRIRPDPLPQPAEQSTVSPVTTFSYDDDNNGDGMDNWTDDGEQSSRYTYT